MASPTLASSAPVETSKDNAREINKAVRRIELDNREECGVDFIPAPEIVFDF